LVNLGALEVVSCDPDWPKQYARWREPVIRALGASGPRVEHVGSTAVPGLAANPVIDVQISVADVADEARYVPQLEATGMRLRATDDIHRLLLPLPGPWATTTNWTLPPLLPAS
jgi:GrpB-like predicted nucleotidyltransferase (UPF0157 family)